MIDSGKLRLLLINAICRVVTAACSKYCGKIRRDSHSQCHGEFSTGYNNTNNGQSIQLMGNLFNAVTAHLSAADQFAV